MNVLVACEESQAVCKAFRDRGHNAFSCDLQKCSGGHPEWHIHDGVLPIIGGGVTFKTQNGDTHTIDGLWDLVIAHPPCTYLTVSGNAWFVEERYTTSAINRYMDRVEAIRFFMEFVRCTAKRVAIENPIGIMSSVYRKPDQIIQPFEFGHPYTKQTCLWLKNLPKLIATDILEKPSNGWVNQSFTPDGRYGGFKNFNGSKERSKTFEGIAVAMAEQWGDGIVNVNEKHEEQMRFV